jgi:hypothetical protein
MVFWQDQDMTMPGYDDSDVPRLSEIARTLSDFRQEFRNSLQDMVRKDVYQESRAALEARVVTLELKLRDADAQSRSKSNLLYGTALAAGVSLLGWILTALVGA